MSSITCAPTYSLRRRASARCSMRRFCLMVGELRVALNLGTHDHWPSLNQTVLIVGSLNAVDAHELLDDAVNSFCIAFSHNSNL